MNPAEPCPENDIRLVVARGVTSAGRSSSEIRPRRRLRFWHRYGEIAVLRRAEMPRRLAATPVRPSAAAPVCHAGRGGGLHGELFFANTGVANIVRGTPISSGKRALTSLKVAGPALNGLLTETHKTD